MKLLVTFVATSLAMLASGFGLGVASVPSPVIEHRIAQAELDSCSDWLTISVALGLSASHRLTEHLDDEIGPLPPLDELRDDVARLRATIATETDGGRL